MVEGIAYQAKDILFKAMSEMFKDQVLDMYGLKFPKIISMLPNEFPAVKVDEKRADNVFLLEDGTILLLEYESNSRITENSLNMLSTLSALLTNILETIR